MAATDATPGEEAQADALEAALRRYKATRWARRITLPCGWLAFAAAVAARGQAWSWAPVALGFSLFAAAGGAALAMRRQAPRLAGLTEAVNADTARRNAAIEARVARMEAIEASLLDPPKPPEPEGTPAVALLVGVPRAAAGVPDAGLEGAAAAPDGRARDGWMAMKLGDGQGAVYGRPLASHLFDGTPPKAVRVDRKRLRQAFAQAREAGLPQARLYAAQGWSRGR